MDSQITNIPLLGNDGNIVKYAYPNAFGQFLLFARNFDYKVFTFRTVKEAFFPRGEDSRIWKLINGKYMLMTENEVSYEEYKEVMKTGYVTPKGNQFRRRVCPSAPKKRKQTF